MTRSRPKRGLSLLETMVATFILAMTLWSVQVLYVGLLKGTGLSESRKLALAESETLFLYWKEKAREHWPVDPDPEDYIVNGDSNGYVYRVEVSARLSNPNFNHGSDVEFLEMRRLNLTLEYLDDNQEKTIQIKGAVAR